MSPQYIANQLKESYPVTPAQSAQYREQGFIKLKNVLSMEVLDFYAREITAQVQQLNTQTLPMEKRNTYQKAFLQIMNLWTYHPLVKEFVFSQRLARLAAELMGVKGVRLYHDQALYKEPGGGHTPWHADQFYWPLATDHTTTVWIPLQATPIELGPLAFSAGSQRYHVGRDLEISDDSEQRISKELLEKHLPMNETPFDLGEVSFHAGWTFHRAGPNATTKPRRVMTIIYFEDSARLATPNNKAQETDWNRWMPGAKIGEVVDTPLNPLLYQNLTPET